jgi:protease-4
MTPRRRGTLLLSAYLLCMAAAAWQLRKPAGAQAAGASGSGREVIAVVELQGPITLSLGNFGGTDVEGTLRHLRSLRDRPEVKAVLLRINSPGGSVAAVQEIHQEVLALKKAGKKVIASFGDVAASGGYYIAAAADKIVADPGTLTGSIGVILQMGNVQELFKKVGLRVETFKSGEMKDAGSPFRPLREEERRVYQRLVTDAYEQFFRAVAEGRGMTDARLRPLADGRVFTGVQAKDAGLVDVLGNFETSVQVARELAGIRAEKPALLYAASPWERFFHVFAGRLIEGRWPAALPSKRIRFEYVWE